MNFNLIKDIDDEGDDISTEQVMAAATSIVDRIWCPVTLSDDAEEEKYCFCQESRCHVMLHTLMMLIMIQTIPTLLTLVTLFSLMIFIIHYIHIYLHYFYIILLCMICISRHRRRG